MSSGHYSYQGNKINAFLEVLKNKSVVLKSNDVDQAQVAYFQISQTADIINYILVNEFWLIYNFLYVFPDRWLDAIRSVVELKSQGVIVSSSDGFMPIPNDESVDDLIEDVLFNQRWFGTITPNEVNMIINIFTTNNQSDLLVLVPRATTNNMDFGSWPERLSIMPNAREVIASLSNKQRRTLRDAIRKGEYQHLIDLVHATSFQ